MRLINQTISHWVTGGLFVLALTSGPGLAIEPASHPLLGFNGTLVDLPSNSVVPGPGDLPNRGMRVDTISRGTPASRAGLERGDTLISIDSMRFTTFAGYHQALRCSGQRPSLMIIDRRTGRLVRRSVDLPHKEPAEGECGARPPDTYLMAIDLVEDLQGER